MQQPNWTTVALAALGASIGTLGIYKFLQNCPCFTKKPVVEKIEKIEMTKKQKEEEYQKTFEELVEFIVSEFPSFELPDEAQQYLKRMIEYTVVGGKCNRAMAVLDTLLHLKHNMVSREDVKKAIVAGWCIEWLQAFFLVADDIMDQSELRRGKPCWYKLEDVKMGACNDYLILHSHIHRILKHYFANDENYLPLLELFNETAYRTELGQLLDTRLSITKKKVTDYSLDLYKLIVKYKTAFYTFYLPVAAGLIIGGVKDQTIFERAKEICIQIGEYFQIQDDYLDCYGSPEVIGKIGRDIEEGKCCWLVVQALNAANEEEKQILINHYGKDNKEDVQKVKELYEKLKIAEKYQQYERETSQELRKRIANLKEVNPQIFISLLEKIEARSK